MSSNWAIIGAHYRCKADQQGNLITDRSNRKIHAVSGKHQDWNSNASVKSVGIGESNCFYFPLDVEKFFGNLEGFTIQKSKLSEIRKEDLKQLKNLRMIDLYFNEIQYLERNLFEFNPKLEYIAVHDNKITHIDPHVFDKLIGKLNVLLIARNICQLGDSWNKNDLLRIYPKIQNGFCKDESKFTAVLPVNSEHYLNLIEEVKQLREKVGSQEEEMAAMKNELELAKTNVEVLIRHISEIKKNLMERITSRGAVVTTTQRSSYTCYGDICYSTY